jgi:hypothetical protein
MKRLRRFWKALDEVPGVATDRLEWTDILGAEWSDIAPYLKSTGRRTTAVLCPYPGGDGCPRRVITSANGALRAVCGSHPQVCDPLDLTGPDVTILALDRAKLLRELAGSLDAEPPDKPAGAGRVMKVGRHALAAGLAAPILLALPGPMAPLIEDDLRTAGLDPAGSVVLIPRPSSLSASLQGRLLAAGHQVIPLCEAIGLGTGGLEALQPPAILLKRIRDSLAARMKAKPGSTALRVPQGTRWEQITLVLTSTATLVCRTPGWSRQLDPGELGMRSGKNNRPTLAWTFLVSLAECGGALSVRDRSKEASFRKQKEHLSRHLRDAFGLTEDPLPWDTTRGAYVARFMIRDDRPVGERGPRRR